MRIKRVILTLLCCISLLPSAVIARTGSKDALGPHLTPCLIGRMKTPARCGTFGVYEHRTTQSGRIIALHLIVVPAKHPTHHAIAEIAGGPGQAVTEFAAPMIDGVFGGWRAAQHDTYDFVFMDDRGMGTSNPFPCSFAPPNDPASYFRYLYPPKLVAACRAHSAASHDLSAYTTNNTVDDLDEIRAALGYDKIVLDGGSYGTFFSFTYMRRHPQHVQSAILDGVDPPHFQAVPGEPLGAQKALDDLVAKCRADSTCNARFPHFADHFNAVVNRLNRGPLAVPVHNLATKRVQTVELSKEVFVDSLRHVLYSPEGAAYIPYAIERAYAKDYAPLAEMVQTVVVGFATDLNMGAFLSYSCADWVPFITPQQLAEARARSFAGDLRYRAQQGACATWHVPVMDASFNDPVRSAAPVLMILGSDDPATPPQYGLDALRYLPNGRAIVVKGAGHGADTSCTDKLEAQFMQTGSAAGLDVDSCSETLKLPPFATSMKGWP